MGKTSEDTDRDMRRAMAIFESRVLDSKNFDPATANYRYDGPITEAAIRKIAGVKSRSTLRPEYHAKLRDELKTLVCKLKFKTGKIPIEGASDNGEEAPAEQRISEISRSERLAQTIAALSFRIMVLEREIASLRAGNGAKADNVTILTGRRRKRERNENAKI